MQRINEDIKTGNFKQIYLLYGEERYLKNQYTTRLRKALCQEGDEMNTHFYQGKDFSVGEVIDLAETLPFLAERRVMFFKDTGLFKSGGEKLAEYLASPNDTTFFVFTESEVDMQNATARSVAKRCTKRCKTPVATYHTYKNNILYTNLRFPEYKSGQSHHSLHTFLYLCCNKPNVKR